MTVKDRGVERLHLYSGAVRELHERGMEVRIHSFDTLLDSVVVPSDPLERIDRIILHVFSRMETDDATVKLFDHDYSVAYAKHASQFKFLIDRANELGFLDRSRNGPEDDCRLTIEGWRHVAELKKDEMRTNQAFVAMSFDDSLRFIYLDGVKPAIERTGYMPLRLDESKYNERFDDRIIAEIRKSGLVIADVTGHNKGVYFEAGFALGLGIDVIWTCRNTDINQAHPNTRQYNHIVWENAHDLREKLIVRIEATLPLKRATNRTNVWGDVSDA
jgi:nucleoside 2-deoxyribosyltransferase